MDYNQIPTSCWSEINEPVKLKIPDDFPCDCSCDKQDSDTESENFENENTIIKFNTSQDVQNTEKAQTNMSKRHAQIDHYQITKSSETNYENWTDDAGNLIIAMVGLPGRGKTYISKRLCRWLNWKGLTTKVFNAGSYRRELFSDDVMDHKWFNPLNDKNVEKREQIISLVCDDLETWLDVEGHVAILDATNSTVKRRSKIRERFADKRLLFVETICDIQSILNENFLSCKLKNEDYQKIDKDKARQDFNNRVTQYKKAYAQLDLDRDSDVSFIQLYNLGQQIKLNRIYGQLPQKISYFLMNLNPATHKIYLTRHGQSQGQLKKIIGGNSCLTEAGIEYSHNLKKFMDKELNEHKNVSVMCSTLNRSVQTSKVFLDDLKYSVTKWKTLDEIHGGLFEEYSYDYVKEKYPEIHDQRMNNKYVSSWPGGETYRNMIARLENVFLEIERSDVPIIIVAHQAICRGLYAYLLDMNPEQCVNIEIPSHHVFEFYYEDHKHKFKVHDLSE